MRGEAESEESNRGRKMESGKQMNELKGAQFRKKICQYYGKSLRSKCKTIMHLNKRVREKTKTYSSSYNEQQELNCSHFPQLLSPPVIG